ncbi:hypothetical protein B2G71_01520 [Novosphingobium sp. PC22D]|uniref:hypothetical protein n=1 Tax=Novosphingobium sp. PC22D TaxID=1962403 RepID=UPI000BEF5C78|nr:hypothetical protein [Novosphingobium sp. PC22D]PEQ14308.1 hypothetical protein B2G71_01520 [Novosphingobium sp. PC22D]
MAEDLHPSWVLPEPVEESETEAEAVTGLAQCTSLLTMGGRSGKKKRPVLLLDPEEAAKAYRQMETTAAQDFADPERANARLVPTTGLSPVANGADSRVDETGPEDWRAWAEMTPPTLSVVPQDAGPSPVGAVRPAETVDDETSGLSPDTPPNAPDRASPRAVAPVADSPPAPSPARSDRSRAPIARLPAEPIARLPATSLTRPEQRRAAPADGAPAPEAARGTPPSREPVTVQGAQESRQPRRQKFEEVPFAPESRVLAEAAPEAVFSRLPRGAEPARSALRRDIAVQPVKPLSERSPVVAFLLAVRKAFARLASRN